ncbi:MAG: Crp/Fnr family transcriptional regulator [Gemmatimonadaceae bacterium]|nr:Crp/Fnr family transcriptional regulator [Gemmatimonadaceae bacterium]
MSRLSVTADELRSLDGFRSMPRPAAAALVSHSTVRSFPPNQPLFREGEEAHGIFVVLAGKVRVVRTSRGRRHVLHTEHRGGTLGEAPVFDHDPYPATAIAWTAVDALYVDREGLHRALRVTPDVALFFLSRLAGRVRLLLDRVDRLATANVGTRVCAYLLDQTARGDGAIVPITQESLAEELGTVREVVMRTLRSLRNQRIIGTAGRGKIEILDRAALRALAAE